jgi:hypothetical protein
MPRFVLLVLLTALSACASTNAAPPDGPTSSGASPTNGHAVRLTNVVTSMPGPTSKFCVGATCFIQPGASTLAHISLGDCVSVLIQPPTDNQAATLTSLQGTAGCDAVGQPSPPFLTSLPHPMPKAHVKWSGCRLDLPPASAWYPAQLPPSADSATLLWFSGSAVHTCNSAVTELTSIQADALLTDLHTARGPMAGAAYHCPMDDGRFVEAWFKTAAGFTSFRINLAGCAFYKPQKAADLGQWPTFIHPR